MLPGEVLFWLGVTRGTVLLEFPGELSGVIPFVDGTGELDGVFVGVEVVGTLGLKLFAGVEV